MKIPFWKFDPLVQCMLLIGRVKGLKVDYHFLTIGDTCMCRSDDYDTFDKFFSLIDETFK